MLFVSISVAKTSTLPIPLHLAYPVFLLLAKYRQMAQKNSKMLILAKKFQKFIFLSLNFSSNLTIFIRFDQFSSI
jgi:hypothetical protein